VKKHNPCLKAEIVFFIAFPLSFKKAGKELFYHWFVPYGIVCAEF